MDDAAIEIVNAVIPGNILSPESNADLRPPCNRFCPERIVDDNY